jgi:hypothetical protein
METNSRREFAAPRVDFVLEFKDAEHVYVCGDFNDWHPTSLRMIGNAEMACGKSG